MPKAIEIGASSGIGRELAKLLCAKGYIVGVAGRRERLLHQSRAECPGTTLPSAHGCLLSSSNLNILDTATVADKGIGNPADHGQKQGPED